jgi:hypothetical protein
MTTLYVACHSKHGATGQAGGVAGKSALAQNGSARPAANIMKERSFFMFELMN